MSTGNDPKRDLVERELELGLEQSFPASDPPAAASDPSKLPETETAAERAQEAACAAAESAALDEALEDSFPASDPPSMTAPGGETCDQADGDDTAS